MLNDYELLFLAQECDEEAYKDLFDKYNPVLCGKVKSFKIKHKEFNIDYSEIYSTAVVGFNEAVNGYIGGSGTLFYTFLNICVDRELMKLSDSLNRGNNLITMKAISIDKNITASVEVKDLIKSDIESPEDMLVMDYSVNRLLEKIINYLSSYEVEVLSLRLEGLNPEEVAFSLNRSIKGVYKAMERIKDKTMNIVIYGN